MLRGKSGKVLTELTFHVKAIIKSGSNHDDGDDLGGNDNDQINRMKGEKKPF